MVFVRNLTSHKQAGGALQEGQGLGEEGSGGVEGGGGVFFQPGELLLGVDAGVFLDAGHGCGEVHQPVEVGEQFFVPHGVEGIEVAQVVYAAGLVEQSGVHHQLHAAVHAVEELLPRVVDVKFHYAERALLCQPGAEGRIGHSGFEADFQGVDGAARIAQVARQAVFRVEAAQAVDNGLQPLIFKDYAAALPHGVADGREEVNAFAEGVDVHHGAAAHHGVVPLGELGRGQAQGVLLEPRRRVIGVERQEAHKEMARRLQLLGAGGGGANGYVAVKLAGVGRDDVAAERPGQLYGEASLARAGRPGDYYEGLIFHLRCGRSVRLRRGPSPSTARARTRSVRGS